jgi:hypothetical protein
MSASTKYRLLRAVRWALIWIFVIYPLSAGPVVRLSYMTGWGYLTVIYYPIFWITEFCPPARLAFMLWLMIWTPARYAQHAL